VRGAASLNDPRHQSSAERFFDYKLFHFINSR